MILQGWCVGIAGYGISAYFAKFVGFVFLSAVFIVRIRIYFIFEFQYMCGCVFWFISDSSRPIGLADK